MLARTVANGAVNSGQLRGAGGSGSGDLGGLLTVDVASMPDADALALASTSGRLTGQITLRVRTGDLTLNESMKAQSIALSADAGSLTVGGQKPVTLDASAPSGGVVQLAAGQDLVLASGTRIDAKSTRAGARGGDVLLASTDGRVRVATSAQVDATGLDPQDGRIVLRAPRDEDLRTVAIDPLQTQNLKSGQVALEAVHVYTQIARIAAAPDGDPTTLAQTEIRADNNAFMASRGAVLNSLGVSSAEIASGRVSLRAGVEVRADGDLTVADDWQFAGSSAQPNRDRPGGDAGFLTLRAAGNLLVSGSLSDGFTTAGVLNANARSWSYRLVGGADTSAANPLAVRDLAHSADETGHIQIDAGKLLRTGAGSIELAAGRDVLFGAGEEGTPAAMAYVAGRRYSGSDALLGSLFQGQLAPPTFSEQGGRLDVRAARDVVAPEATQLVGNWLWRSGLPSARPGEAGLYTASSQLAWWTQYTSFNQTLGSFGGGNLSVSAGRDIVNLQAMSPTAGWADSRTAASATIRTLNGGDVSVSAGRDLMGGQFLLGAGVGRLSAGGSIGTAAQNALVQTPILALLDGQWRLAARNDIQVLGAFNPTAVAASGSQSRASLSPYFYTWGPAAGLSVGSNAGKVSLAAGLGEDQLRGFGLDADSSNVGISFQVLPPSLQVTAARDVDLEGLGGAVMAPSATGQLRLWSGADVRLGGAGAAQLAMSDSAPSDWAPPSAPVTRVNNPIVESLVPNTLADALPLTGLHANDPDPVQIHAEGSLQISGTSLQSKTLLLPKRAELTAGLDVLGLSLRTQHLSADDSTRVVAGRNYLAGVYGNVEAAGPGRLDVSAGGSVDLGSSGGLSTSGNQRNASLPARGSDIRVSAATRGTLDVDAFYSTYLRPPATDGGGSVRAAQYRQALTATVGTALNLSGLTFDQAWAYFQAFAPAAQAAVGQQVLAAEFGAVYLSQAAPSAADLRTSLNSAFDLHKAQLLQAGEQALAAGTSLTLPGREVLQGDGLRAYLASIRSLSFSSLDLDSTVAARVAALASVQSGWRDAVAKSLGSSTADISARAGRNPQDPAVLAFNAALAQFSGPVFDDYRQQVLARETASAGATASQFGRLSLPMRLALYDQGFAAAELTGAGSFSSQPYWPGSTPLLRYGGVLNLTQSSIITERGGDISLVNAGGAINVGLKDAATGSNAPKGVIALGGGGIYGYSAGDFQINTQRVFIVGAGDMNIWSSSGDIDSGRGANTAVAAPPLAARRSADGIVFEVPATTTGSGIGILPDATGRLSGSIGLFPALGEILALDAFIRAPSVVLGSSVKGADNLISASIGGAAAPVAAPSLSVAAPPPASANPARTSTVDSQRQDARRTNSLLTVELLGLGAAPEGETCEDKDRVNGKCPDPAKK
jgi:hypothetical protein